MPFPANFQKLHEGEELLRQKSVCAIEASDQLSAHAALIECAMDLINYFCLHHQHRDDDQLTIQLLGIRLFNGAATAMKLLLSGYYQTSALTQRDLLETAFLLALFTRDSTQIANWRSNSNARTFKPVNVRKALDDGDGFTEKKREKAYKLLCTLAGHPSQDGFRMLTQPGGGAHCGPFFEVTALEAVLSELAKIIVQATTAYTRFFEIKTKEDGLMKVAYVETSGRWFQRFFGSTYADEQVAELRALLGMFLGSAPK